MASQMIWLLGYVSLGLALTLGNHPVHNHVQVRSRFDHRAKVPDSTIAEQSAKDLENELAVGPYDLPPDWVAYQARDLIPRHQLKLENAVDYDSTLDDFATALDSGLLELSQSTRGPRPPGSLERLPVSAGVDLNQQLIDRPGLAATTTLKGSSLWSLGSIDYPWKGGGSVETSRLGKRNQVAGRRRLNGDSRSALQPAGGQPPPLPGIPAEIGGMASQFMLRAARGNRQYDVPQIECPSSEDGMERFACPTPDRMGRYRCIDDHVLCDGFIDCPTGEDEDRQACMFYKTTKAHLDVLAEALLRWVRGR